MRPQQPIRVLFINHTGTLGGGELALSELVAHLDRSRVEPFILLMSEGLLLGLLEQYAKVLVLPLNDAVLNTRKEADLGSVTLLRRVTASARYAFRLRKYLRSMQIDLIHTNSLKADIIGGFAAKLCGIPLVWHVRDRITVDYLPARTVKVFRALASLLPDGVITNSRATMASLGHEFGPGEKWRGRRRHQQLAVIHDGVDIQVEDEQASYPHSRPTVGLVGRISPWKGQDVFLRAAALVRVRYPDARFQIIGAAMFGEDEFQSRIKALCSELGLDDVVEFTGFVRNVRSRIRSLTVLVHASTIGEPFGQVIIEGMAAGRPVVATDGGGVPEIVMDQITGLLVPMQDEAAMAESICALLGDFERSRQMGLQGRERVRRNFSMNQTARKVEQVFSSVLAGRQGRPHFAAGYDNLLTSSNELGHEGDALEAKGAFTL